MGRDRHEFEVGGKKYISTHYSGDKGLIIFAKIGKILSRPIGALVEGGMDKTVTKDLIGDIAQGIFDNVEPEKMPDLMREILEGTQVYVENTIRPIIIKTDFIGNILPLFQVVKEVLQFQFGDFLGALAGAAPALAAKQEDKAGRRVRAL